MFSRMLDFSVNLTVSLDDLLSVSVSNLEVPRVFQIVRPVDAVLR